MKCKYEKDDRSLFLKRAIKKKKKKKKKISETYKPLLDSLHPLPFGIKFVIDQIYSL